MSVQDDFFVTLISDESSHFFKKSDNLSEFTNKLPCPLILEQKYKVALTEIYIPPFNYVEEQEQEENIIEKERNKRDLNNKSDQLEIILPALDYKIIFVESVLNEMRHDTIGVDEMLVLCLTKLQMFNEDTVMTLEEIFERELTIEEYYEILSTKLIEVLNGVVLDDLYNPIIDSKNKIKYINLRFPVSIENEGTSNERFLTKVVKIAPKKYESLQQFLRNLFRQVPLNERSIHVLVKAILRLQGKANQEEIKQFREILSNTIDKAANGESENRLKRYF